MLSRLLMVAVFSVGIVATLNIGDAQSEDFKDGVSLTGSRSAVVPGEVNTFDPPCNFASTLPFDKSVYLNPKTEIRIVGRGALLDQCANFGVTGFSAPNFLAWNCAVNVEGTTASLPVVFQFSNLVRGLSLKVGSNIPGSATLVGLNSSGAVVARQYSHADISYAGHNCQANSSDQICSANRTLCNDRGRSSSHPLITSTTLS